MSHLANKDGGVNNTVLLECCILVFFVVFTLVLLLLISWQTYLSLLFTAQKVAKRHSTDKIIAFSELRLRSFTICKLQACIVLTCTNFHPLLCSGILQSKISFVRRSFAGNYPLKATGVSNLATLCVSENLPLFSVSFCSRCL